MRDLVFLPRARQDLRELLVHLRDSAGPAIAEKYADLFSAKLERLQEFPGIGKPRADLGSGVRMLVEEPYLFFYRVEEDRISVLRLVDGRRRITRRLVEGRD